ncbi:putative nucleotide binding protein [Tripterygium wilfordii]|uniref:Elongator complex protein 2 n=1 Tax=Tripterygium wilfordii TaxID=458696 RepID=A0A7J7E018_TRIWF|nr:elongator complex protein 2 [Tripterygium wilfordii]KAF5751893.1 putative nucleotide binding protein [Tripterygium wilfordii]
MSDDSGNDEVEVKRVFIGAGCNRVVNNVSWGACGLVSFGAQNAVAIFCPKSAQILTTLPGHKASVNCTQWLPSSKFAFKAKQIERHYLLSGDADGSIILWEFSLVDKKWRQMLQLPKSHKKGVTCISGIMVSQADAIFASSSSDGLVHIWELVLLSAPGGDVKLSCLESLSVGSKSMVALSLAELPGSLGHIVLAMGGLDNKVHLYCGERTGKFVHACELKGHTDWIRSLDFSHPVCTDGEADIILLVSSSQDKGIRIWKMAPRGSLANTQDAKEISLASYIKGPVVVAGSFSYQISLESLIIGHEDWVYSVEWHPPSSSLTEELACHQPLSILSASMDKTMMIWKPEKTTGIWMNVVTVGELSHCALGFYGGHWSPDGDSILAHGYGGSFHLWRNVVTDKDNWQPQKVPSGHFAAVTDLGWARSGDYMLSVSRDQTTRIFASWKNEASPADEGFWHEIARPQVHGHDINCATIIKGKGNHRIVSGADEKVARVFEASLSFLKTLNHATSQRCGFPEDLQVDVQILGANMSALGLSQKPIYVNAAHESPDRNGNVGMDTIESIPDAVPVVLTEPPIEDILSWHTLWPESHKLYGHGNELFSLCSDHEGKLVVSSCKAQSAAVAEIWLWQVGSWKAVGCLQSHSLTVTQMEFSHDDNLLLAVSRDRQFSVFTIKRTGDEISYNLLARQEAHKRIIWACSWNPYGHEFATGSRDKTVKIWAVDKENTVKQISSLPQFSSSVTALSWVGVDRQRNRGLLAVGMETGLIELWNLSVTRTDDGSIKAPAPAVAARFDPFICHVSTVNRLAWRNAEKHEDSRSVQLASCGADHCVRLFEIIVD